MLENCHILAKGLKMLQQQKFGSVSVIDEIDLNNLIEETIAQNEGRLPSLFIDEENPLSPSSMTIKSPNKSPSSIEELFQIYFVSSHI
uniref:Uncharacterized protein n=1 Tax=Wuchereria bancrofti TaxID=6293 RepID=A0A1I8EHR3_WUCBA